MAPSSEITGDAVTVSAVVLAFNEAGNLPKAVDAVRRAMAPRFADYEIIIVDDGSRDGTGHIADDIAAADSRVVVVHNEKNMGCGYAFRRGVAKARFRYVWLIPGDGEIPQVSLETIADAIGTADMILPYMVNSNIRPWLRRVISWGYTCLINALFFKRLRYYNGPGVFPAEQIRTVPEVHSRGFVFTAPLIITLMKRKVAWKEVGILLKQRDYGNSRINNVRNIVNAFQTITRYYLRLQFSGREGNRVTRI
jgi:dolichol-phosphate mannosyltransferase